MRAKDKEKQEAIERLREWVKPGDKVYAILRHVSRSGMQRSISLVHINKKGGKLNLDYWAARAMGDRIDQKRGGIIVGGCGMDMGFSLVYNLARTLFPKGGPLSKTNGVRRAQAERGGETTETDGGYLLRHEWL